VPRRVLVHARDAFHLARGERSNAGDDFVGHSYCTQTAVASHGADATPSRRDLARAQARSMYDWERVSTRITSPVWMKSGT
jgi:hypothetical protein